VETCAVPDTVLDEIYTRQYIKDMVGLHKQMPPAYSAIKRNGVKAYKAARKGNPLELEPRDVEVYNAELLAIGNLHEPGSLHGLGDISEGDDSRSDPQTSPFPPTYGSSPSDMSFWDLRLEVSKGFYVRALARDVGHGIGSCAHLGALRRTSCGDFSIEDANTLDELKNADVKTMFYRPKFG
jgi:tRNA pseudouridine55 synthase